MKFRCNCLGMFFTARVRSTREGNVLTRVCVSVHTCGGGGGVPHLRSGGRVVPHSRSGGGYPSQVWLGGYPIPGLGGGYPVPGLGLGGTPSQVWPGGYPISGWGTQGTPYPDLEYPGYPPPRPGMGYPPPRPGMGYTPPRPGMGYPLPEMGYPHLDLGWGTPPT